RRNAGADERRRAAADRGRRGAPRRLAALHRRLRQRVAGQPAGARRLVRPCRRHAGSAVKRRALLGALAAAPLLPPLLLPLFAARARAGEAAASTVAATFGRLPAPADVRRVFAGGAPASALLAVLAPEKL